MLKTLNSGIYIIENIKNGKMYVGSSARFDTRLNQHRIDLNGNRHLNNKLQNAWNKYGESAFEFTVLEYLDPVKEVLIFREQYWMDLLDVYKTGYNMVPIAYSRLGTKASDETKAKMSISRKGRVFSAETRAKMSMSQMGNTNGLGKIKSAETRAKLSVSNTGRVCSEETKAKISAANTGNTYSLGKIYSAERRANISASQKGKILTDEHKAKIAASALGKKRGYYSEKGRANIAAANKKRVSKNA